MHKFHKSIYNAMTDITVYNRPRRMTPTLRYLIIQEYLEVTDTKETYITEKGLTLLGRLESFKHNDLSRIITWLGVVVSLLAVSISIIGIFWRSV